MRNNIKKSLDELKTTDVYSMVLFALYQLGNDTQYSTLSELVYILDKKSLFNFLECYGGMTIKVPTVKELKIIVNALLLYELVQLEGISIEEAYQQIDAEEFHFKDIKDVYLKVCSILEKYDFKRN